MNIQKTTTFIFLVAIAALIVGFHRVIEFRKSSNPPHLRCKSPVRKFPLVLSYRWQGRLTESFGIPISQGFELALNEINAAQPSGGKLKFIIENDHGTVEGAVAAFNKLIHQDGVSVILGPATSSQTEEAFAVAQENQVVAISPTSAARGLSAIGNYVFRVALTTDVLTPSGIEATHTKLGYQQATTLYDEADFFSTDADAAVQEVLAANGVEVLITETFQGGDTDFSEQLTRIHALDPDVIFVSSLPPEKPGILTQGHQLGISAPLYSPHIDRSRCGSCRHRCRGCDDLYRMGCCY